MIVLSSLIICVTAVHGEMHLFLPLQWSAIALSPRRNVNQLRRLTLRRALIFAAIQVPWYLGTWYPVFVEIAELKGIYALDLDAKASHRLREQS